MVVILLLCVLVTSR